MFDETSPMETEVTLLIIIRERHKNTPQQKYKSTKRNGTQNKRLETNTKDNRDKNYKNASGGSLEYKTLSQNISELIRNQ